MPDSIRLLVIGAHPADVFDQSGGTMAHHTTRGDWVGCVVLTHGARIHDKVISDGMFRRAEVPNAEELTKLMAVRSDAKAQEVTRACQILGVKDVYFLGADDAVLLVTEQLVRQVATMIRQLRPNLVLTHFPKECGGIGNAHAVAGEIVMNAIALAAAVDAGDTRPPHRVAQVFFFGQGAAAIRTSVWGAEGGFYNDVFVDITDVVEKKLEALDALASQGYGGAYARKRIEGSDGSFGMMVNLPYAEGFISWKSTTHYYLPLSESDLEQSRVPDHELTRRVSFMIGDKPREPAR